MKYEIEFKGFSKKEEKAIHHDFLMLLNDEIKSHIDAIIYPGIDMGISDQEDKITLRKASIDI